jgi:dihydropteroate synthase
VEAPLRPLARVVAGLPGVSGAPVAVAVRVDGLAPATAERLVLALRAVRVSADLLGSSVGLMGAPAQIGSGLREVSGTAGPFLEVADGVGRALEAWARPIPASIPAAHRRIPLGPGPRVMGVVNVTPDSFSDGGRFLDPARAAEHAERLVAEGADLIDLGAESTRPGASPVAGDAEWRRLEPVLARLTGRLSVPVSVDTRHAEVARRAVEAGADLVNDVEGLRSEPMRRVVSASGAAAVLMHMRGDPTTMQSDLRYGDLRAEVFRSLAEAMDAAEGDGVSAERLLVDPGLGFGKSPAQSLELLLNLGELRSLGPPVVVGASRKSFLGWSQGAGGPTERLEAGLAAAVLAVDRGAAIVRTHDVAPTVRALSLLRRARAGAAPAGAA